MKGKRKSVFKRIGRTVGGKAVLLLQRGSRWVPLGGIRLLGRWGGDFLFVLLRRKRVRTIRNLQLALNMPEARSVARRNFRHLVLLLPEMFKFYGLPAEEIRRRIPVEGLEHLEEAQRRGKGTICVSAHLGNFLLIPLRLSLEGYSFTLLVRGEKNTQVEDLFLGLRNQVKITTLYRGQSYFSLVKALKRNEMLWFFLDQFPRRSEITVPFLDFAFPGYAGHTRLAHLTGAVILPLGISRLKDEATHRLRILPPVEVPDRSGSPEEGGSSLVALQPPLQAIEGLIRLSPAEWLWWHKDWFRSKTKYSGN